MTSSINKVVVICDVLVFCGAVSAIEFCGSAVGVTLALVLIGVVVVAVELDVAVCVDTSSVVELSPTVDSVVVFERVVVIGTD